MRLSSARIAGATVCALLACALTACASDPLEAKCEVLENLQLGGGKVASASVSREGYHFSWSSALLTRRPFIDVPAFCRVKLVLTPSEDSHIRSEVWLPKGSWNGKFQGIGNGGLAGSMDELQLMLSVRQGYAVAATDTGHDAGDQDGSWALGHPQKVIDYGYRGIHETAVAAKAVIAAYYGSPARYSYFSACSNGGRSALMEAQRYPEDYDGIIAGAPAYDATNTIPTWAWLQQNPATTPGSYIPPRKLAAISEAVRKACDSLDGVADGVIEDPPSCGFDPKSLMCAGKETDDCLTEPQVQGLRKIYAGPGGALDGSSHRGFEPGAELGMASWKDWITGAKPNKSLQYVFTMQFYRYLVHENEQWGLSDFDFAPDRAAMRDKLGPVLDARDPDLSGFKARGGKLILYHGWNDAALQPRLAVDYYRAVQARMGEDEAAQFVRLYMVPGMHHCIGGPGPNNFGQLPPAGSADPARNVNAALEAWVEHGRAPAGIVATKYEDDWKALLLPERTPVIRTRPLCPYPQKARWKESGSTDLAENFVCAP